MIRPFEKLSNKELQKYFKMAARSMNDNLLFELAYEVCYRTLFESFKINEKYE